mgnify:CR=1 FL=1
MSITTTVIAKEAREAREELKKELSGDCIDYNVKRDRPVSKECSDKNFLETYGISKEQYRANVMKELEKDHKSDLTIALERRAESDANFLKTWGISKDDFYDQTMKYLKDHREEFKQIQEAREFVEKHEKYEREQESARTFKETWGMSKEEMYEKNLAEVRANDKIEQALDKMAKILVQTETDQEEIGSVFEKPQYPDLKDGLTEVKGIDQKVLDSLKDQVDKLDNNKKEAELKNRDEATMSGPKGHSSTLDMLK